MRKTFFSLLLSLAISLVLAPLAHAEIQNGPLGFCNFTPSGNPIGDITISNSCVIYEDINGVALGDLTIAPGAAITLYHTLVWYPNNKINISNGGLLYINTNGKIVQNKICYKDSDQDGIPDPKSLTNDPNTGQTVTSSLTQLDSTLATPSNSNPPVYSCPAGYSLRESFNSLAYYDSDPNQASASIQSTSDPTFLGMGFSINGVTDANAAAGDIVVGSNKNLIITPSGKLGVGLTSGATPAQMIDVASTSNTNIKLDSGAGLASSILSYNSGVAGSGLALFPASDTRAFGVYKSDLSNATMPFVVLQNGNVGIGKTNPGTSLDVNGVITTTSGTSTQWNTAYSHSQSVTGGEHGATSANTANMIVRRDASGNFTAGTITAALSGNASTATNVAWSGITSKPFNWSGQAGQPSWLWGSNDGINYYVWNPSNFSVNYATSAGNADTLDSLHASSFAQFNTWQNNHYSGTDGAEYATTFYDTNNGAYYADPASTSNFNIIQFVANGGTAGAGVLAGSSLQLNNNPTLNIGFGVPEGANRAINFRINGLNLLRLEGTNNEVYVYDSIINARNVNFGLWTGNAKFYVQTDSNLISYQGSTLLWAASWTNGWASDQRLKDNIKPLTHNLDKIMTLNPVSFTWNDKIDPVNKSLPTIGLIAQDVQKVFPEVVYENPSGKDKGYLKLRYEGLVGPIVGAIQEQQKELDEQKALILELQKEIKSLKKSK